MQSSAKCLGLIGGLGPPATVHYYNALVAAFGARKVALRMVMSHAEASAVIELVLGDKREALASYLAEHIERLAKAGADFAAIPAVAPHACAPILAKQSALPLVDIVDAVRDEIHARGIRRISLMGTRRVMESKFFGRLDGIDIVPPAPADVDFIHETYMGIVRNEGITPAAVERLRAIARAMIAEHGVEAVALAGTDLAVAFDEANAGFPAIDCARVHIDAIVKAMTA